MKSPDKLLKILFLHVDIGTLIHSICYIYFHSYKKAYFTKKEDDTAE